jgi:hypothetical protein
VALGTRAELKALGERFGNERMAQARWLEQPPGTMRSCTPGGMNQEAERSAVDVDHRVAFAVEDPFGSVEASGPAAFRDFYQSVVNHHRRRARLPAAAFAIGYDERMAPSGECD